MSTSIYQRAVRIDARGCGIGKTETIIKHAINDVILADQRVLIVQSGIKLNQQTEQRLRDAYAFSPRKVRALNSQNTRSGLLSAISDAVNEGADIILITSEAFTQMPLDIFKGWSLYIDEALNVLQSESVSIEHCYKNVLADVTAHKDDQYLSLSLNTDWLSDDWLRTQAFAKKLSNPHWRVFTAETTWLNLSRRKKLTYHAVFGAGVTDIFASVWVAAAAFTETLHYKAWSAMGIPMEVVKPFAPYKTPNLTIAPLSPPEHSYWSKRHLDENRSQYERIAKKLTKELRGQRVLHQTNNRNGLSLPGLRVSHNPHGMNDLQDYNHVVLTSALRPTPQEVHFAEAMFGLSVNELIRARMTDLYHQTIMRTALRTNEDAEVTVWVPCNGTAVDLIDTYFSKAKFSTEFRDEFWSDNQVTKRVKKQMGRPPSGIDKKTQQRLRKAKYEFKKHFGSNDRWDQLLAEGWTAGGLASLGPQNFA